MRCVLAKITTEGADIRQTKKSNGMQVITPSFLALPKKRDFNENLKT